MNRFWMTCVIYFIFRYHDQLTAMGDSHLRNLFYFTITYLDPTYINQQKVHRDMNWQEHRYIWTTNSWSLMQDLESYSRYIEKTYSDFIAMKSSKRHLLYVGTSVWQMISRPTFDYINSIDCIIPLLEKLQMMGVEIVWQNMPSSPTPDFTKEMNMYKYIVNRSNSVIGGQNYIICQMLSKVSKL